MVTQLHNTIEVGSDQIGDDEDEKGEVNEKKRSTVYTIIRINQRVRLTNEFVISI